MTEAQHLALEQIIEGLLLAANKPLPLNQITAIFEDSKPDQSDIMATLKRLQEQCNSRGIELVETASGWHYQVKKKYGSWISRLWEEKPQKYTRALLETLAIIVYRQPITRGDIEEIRGVAVSSNIIRTLQEREWIRVVGHRDAPGRPAMHATTRQFMDYFNLKSLSELPPLMEIKALDESEKIALNTDVQLPLTQEKDTTTGITNMAKTKASEKVIPLTFDKINAQKEEHASNMTKLFKELDALEADIKTNYTDLLESDQQISNNSSNTQINETKQFAQQSETETSDENENNASNNEDSQVKLRETKTITEST